MMVGSGEPQFQQPQLPGPCFLSSLGGAYLNNVSVGFFLEKFLLNRLWAKVTQMFSGFRSRRESISWDHPQHPQALGMIHSQVVVLGSPPRSPGGVKRALDYRRLEFSDCEQGVAVRP